MPAVVDAARDRRLQHSTVRVLLYLHTVLEFAECRRMKHWVVARELGMQRQSVSKAIGQLVECGYIHEGSRQEHNVHTYMLLGSIGEAFPIPSGWRRSMQKARSCA